MINKLLNIVLLSFAFYVQLMALPFLSGDMSLLLVLSIASTGSALYAVTTSMSSLQVFMLVRDHFTDLGFHVYSKRDVEVIQETLQLAKKNQKVTMQAALDVCNLLLKIDAGLSPAEVDTVRKTKAMVECIHTQYETDLYEHHHERECNGPHGRCTKSQAGAG